MPATTYREYGSASSSSVGKSCLSPSRATKSRVIASEKLAAAQTIGLRINLGCGHIPLEGYVNVDQRELHRRAG